MPDKCMYCNIRIRTLNHFLEIYTGTLLSGWSDAFGAWRSASPREVVPVGSVTSDGFATPPNGRGRRTIGWLKWWQACVPIDCRRVLSNPVRLLLMRRVSRSFVDDGGENVGWGERIVGATLWEGRPPRQQVNETYKAQGKSNECSDGSVLAERVVVRILFACFNNKRSRTSFIPWGERENIQCLYRKNINIWKQISLNQKIEYPISLCEIIEK